ncbi:hypothetical protein MTO96_020603 [Rhipicephalus appendiculatus]
MRAAAAGPSGWVLLTPLSTLYSRCCCATTLRQPCTACRERTPERALGEATGSRGKAHCVRVCCGGSQNKDPWRTHQRGCAGRKNTKKPRLSDHDLGQRAQGRARWTQGLVRFLRTRTVLTR